MPESKSRLKVKVAVRRLACIRCCSASLSCPIHRYCSNARPSRQIASTHITAPDQLSLRPKFIVDDYRLAAIQVGQPHTQSRMRPKRKRPDGLHGTAHRDSNLLVVHFFITLHHHGMSLPFRQGCNSRTDRIQARLSQKSLIHSRLPVGKLPAPAIRSYFVQTLLILTQTLVPAPVRSEIGRNTVDPGAEFRRRFVPQPRAANPEKYFLCQILRYCIILHHPVQKAHDRHAIFVRQLRQASFFAASHAEHQNRIRTTDLLEGRRSWHRARGELRYCQRLQVTCSHLSG